LTRRGIRTIMVPASNGTYVQCMLFLHIIKYGKDIASMFGFDRITSNPNVLGGKACIRDMRISVSLIVNLVANGMTPEEILDEYPDLEREDIQQALRYAAWTAEDIVYFPAETSS
jgi:uncharacterized protein (DUF433 family)